MLKTFVFLCFFIPVMNASSLKKSAAFKNLKDLFSDPNPAKRLPACESGYVEPRECPGWIDDCQSSSPYYQWMLQNCKETCGVCKAGPPPYSTPQNIPCNTADCLSAHNAKRALHGVPALQWNATLASESAAWALHLANQNPVDLIHSEANGAYGENLYYKGSSPAGTLFSCRDGVNAWYDEIKDYNYNSPGFSSGTGHFTQVVWKATTNVGVGMAAVTRDGFTYTFVVARYKPAGNMEGAFAENVPPLV